jgi:leucyl/phenylalanyl-tRNA---protein transferase
MPHLLIQNFYMSSLHLLNSSLWFPPVEDALEDGLLAMGGDLQANRIFLAYQKGIFPWFSGDVPLWWSPDPRFVLYPEHLKVSKSMKVLLKRNSFSVTTNQQFARVIEACAQAERKEQDGTWITKEVANAYSQLHQMGIAHSVEAWQHGVLVGGLYGLKMGKVFFGESMFSHVANASKYAFITYVQQLIKEGIQLIDCQVYTTHLESLGAVLIPRKKFIAELNILTKV